MGKIEIEKLSIITDEVVKNINNLVDQLTNNATPLTKTELETLVCSELTTLFVVKKETKIIATLSVILYQIPTGMKALIEDVVVDYTERGKGVGKAMIQYAIEYISKLGIKKIDLTSNTQRIVANELYKQVGFCLRDTNVYRYEI